MRQCKKCNTKFEDNGNIPNPKCPKCKTRATTKMHQTRQKQKPTENKKSISMWQILQARKAGLFKKEAEK